MNGKIAEKVIPSEKAMKYKMPTISAAQVAKESEKRYTIERINERDCKDEINYK